MNLICSLSGINLASVIVATALAFAVGGLWYSTLLFGNIWQKELNNNPEDVKKPNMALIFGTTFFLNLVSAIFLDALIGVDNSLWGGLATGFIVSVVFIVPALGTNYLFAQRSFKLFLVDSGYFKIFLLS